MGGTGGSSSADLTGLTPEQIATIGTRRAGADAERTKVANLLRLQEASKANVSLKQQEINNTTERIKNTKAYQTGTLGLRGKELNIAKRRIDLDESLKSANLNATKARTEANEGLATKYEAEASKLTKLNGLIDLFLGNEEMTDIQTEIARDALGLGSNKTSDRLNQKAAMNAKLSLEENKDNKVLAGIYLDRLYKSEPKGNIMWYWDTGSFDNEVKSVPLPVLGGQQVTVEEVLAYGQKNGMNVEQTLKALKVLK